MSEQQSRAGDDDRPRMSDVDEGLHVGFIDADGFEERVRLEMHNYERSRDRSHVDLTQAEYTPERAWRWSCTPSGRATSRPSARARTLSASPTKR